jgi:hypothetical protein
VRRMAATLWPKSDVGKGSPVADDGVRLEGYGTWWVASWQRNGGGGGFRLSAAWMGRGSSRGAWRAVGGGGQCQVGGGSARVEACEMA